MKFIKLLRGIHLASVILLFSLSGFTQSFPVTSKITNANGEALAGVTVKVNGSYVQTITSNGGEFTAHLSIIHK